MKPFFILILAFRSIGVESIKLVVLDTWCQLWGTSACVYDHKNEINKQLNSSYLSHSTTSYSGHLITTMIFK